MLPLLIRKELLSHLLSLRFAITLLLQVGALLVSFVVMAGQYEGAQRHYRANVTAAQAANEFGDETADYFDYEHVYRRGSYVARAPNPMSWLARGLEGAVPNQVHISQDHQRQVDKGMYRNPLTERIAAPDLLFLTRMLLSLLAMLFAFDAVCGEREEGTLKQALTNAVPRHLWLMGKWIGGMITLCTGFLLAVLAGLVYLVLQGIPGLSGQQLTTFGAASGVALLYMAVFYTLGMLISTLVRQPATSVVVSLLVWAVVTLVLPGLAVELGKVLSPSPSRADVIVERWEIVKEIRETIGKARRDMPDGQGREAKIAGLEADRNRRLNALQADYWGGVLSRAETVKTLSRALPSGCLTHALTGLAGTDVRYVSNFRAAQGRLKTAFESMGDSRPGPVNPTLAIAHRDFAERLDGAVIDIGLLALYLVALFAATCLGFLRYDIR